MFTSAEYIEVIKEKDEEIRSLRKQLEFARKFRRIRTTTGEELVFDDEDYEVLRNNTLFFDVQRQIVMTTGKTTKGGNVAIPIGKILLNAEGKCTVHHKDKNRLNFKRNNLELISLQKAQFKNKISKNNTSGYKGVSWNKNAKKYSAKIKVEGKNKHLGYHGSAHDAALAYNHAAVEYFGEEYALLNKISWNEKIK